MTMRREMNNGSVILKEKETVTEMIKLYCKKKHHSKQELCHDCQDLQDYALKRLSFCQFGEAKTACSNCSVHCYKPEYRQKIKDVMRFSGPWMLLYHPLYAVKHLFKK